MLREQRQFLEAVLKPTAGMLVALVMELRTLPRVKKQVILVTNIMNKSILYFFKKMVKIY